MHGKGMVPESQRKGPDIMATNVTLALASQLTIRTVGEGSAKRDIKLDMGKLSPEVMAKILEGGARIILTNVFNGGGKERSEVERVAQLEKKIDGWYRGEYTTVERGESQYTAMREQYKQERLDAAGMTGAEVDKAIKATVAAVFGDKESATFPKFLLAVATQKFNAMPKEEVERHFPAISAHTIADEIEAGLAKRTAEAAAKRAETAKGLNVEGIDLGL